MAADEGRPTWRVIYPKGAIHEDDVALGLAVRKFIEDNTRHLVTELIDEEDD